MNTNINKISISFYINIILLLIVLCNPIFSQNNASSLALSGSSSAKAEFWSIQENIAGITRLENIKVGISAENRFLLKEMNFYELGLLIPLNWGCSGLLFSHKGFNGFNTNSISCVYARNFGENFSSGLKLCYQRTNYSSEINYSEHISFDLGLRSRISNEICIAILLKNPSMLFNKNTKAHPEPFVINLGNEFTITDQLILYLSVLKTLNKKPLINAGMEYIFQEKINLRMGFSPCRPFKLAFGFGLKYGSLTIELASSYHYILGFTPCISLTNSFGK